MAGPVRRLSVLAAVVACAGIASPPAAALAKEQVPGLQVALYRHGFYKGPIDGIAGPLTKQAIVRFQRAAKLEADGVAGKQTRTALGRLGAPLFGKRTLKRGMVGFDVSVLQFLLARHGLPPQRLNSNFGPVTEELVAKFQKRAGLTADGVVGRKTRAALLRPRGKAKAKVVVRRPTTRGVAYVVRPGDTLTAIATRSGTTIGALARANRLRVHDLLLIGTRLVVPRVRVERSPASWVRTRIDHWAAHYGVPRQLARALAWQESGYQSDVRSTAGAAGVMQVTPATWAYVEMFLIGKQVPATTDGNIRVGVRYLSRLLTEFDGRERFALAAYYQGPASVRKRGLLPETRRFVANVQALKTRV